MGFQAKFVHEGYRVDYTPNADTAPGTVVVQGALVGVVTEFIPANKLGSLCRRGVFDVVKAAGGSTGAAAGVKIYWDNTAHAGTITASGNTLMGVTELAAADGDTIFRVILNQ